PQILVPSSNSELPKVQHFKPGEKSSIHVKNEEDEEVSLNKLLLRVPLQQPRTPQQAQEMLNMSPKL
ncbi:unnamed protein product, partial [Auanema sp. JU1783]